MFYTSCIHGSNGVKKYRYVDGIEYESNITFWSQGFLSSCNPETYPFFMMAGGGFCLLQKVICMMREERGQAILYDKDSGKVRQIHNLVYQEGPHYSSIIY